MITSHILSPDTQATLLLCGIFSQTDPDIIPPLTISEYSDVAQWLLSQKLRPADLLQPEMLPHLRTFTHPKISVERLESLLKRGGVMALAVENWTNKGLWILSRSDAQYPKHFKEKLKHVAPPILYGVGNQTLLDRGGLGIVGSRDVDEAGLTFTREVVAMCGDEHVQIVSGGARGVDTTAMLSALENDGQAIGVLADSLARAAVSKQYREGLKKGSLVLISPYYPEAGFSVGNAMGRNRYIYTLSDATLVVDSGLSSGGTWHGAIENLNKGWVPLLVRTGEGVPEGNKRLIELGGIPVSLENFAAPKDFQAWLCNLPLPNGGVSISLKQSVPKVLDGLFEVVWPHLEAALYQPITDRELAHLLNLHIEQVQAWLTYAVTLGKVKRLTAPERYVATIAQEVQQLTLFN
jgi:predicted Rossmann fold nucleotide-binding protein DprA/Smf involved in DNA uptake